MSRRSITDAPVRWCWDCPSSDVWREGRGRGGGDVHTVILNPTLFPIFSLWPDIADWAEAVQSWKISENFPPGSMDG